MSLNSLRTALCESIRYQAKSEQNVRQDLDCGQYRNSLQTFRNSRVLEIGNFAKRLQTFRY